MTIKIKLILKISMIAFHKLGFPGHWEDNIMHCVESSKLSVLWNGKQLSWITPTRGIDKGTLYPCISLYFVWKNWDTSSNQQWRREDGNQSSLLDQVPFSLIFFFADDLILFGKASLDQIHVWTVLNLFTGCQVKRLMMGHGVDSYLALNEIGSPNPMMNFIIINYLFNCIFGFIR